MTGLPTDGPTPTHPVAGPGRDDAAGDLGAGDPQAGAPRQGLTPSARASRPAGPTGQMTQARRHPGRRPRLRRPPAHDAEPTGERLQKVLARAGIGSRRVCEELIADGPGHGQRGRRRTGSPGRRGGRRRLRRRRGPLGPARPGALPAQQAGGGGHHVGRPPGAAHRDRPAAQRPPGLLRRPPRHRHRGAAGVDQRRGPGPPPDPPPLRGREGVPGHRGRRPHSRRGAASPRGGPSSTTDSPPRPRCPSWSRTACAS